MCEFEHGLILLLCDSKHCELGTVMMTMVMMM